MKIKNEKRISLNNVIIKNNKKRIIKMNNDLSYFEKNEWYNNNNLKRRIRSYLNIIKWLN